MAVEKEKLTKQEVKSKKKTPMKETDKLEFDELYDFVKFSVFNYKKEQALPSVIVLRLKGMAEGKYIANNKTKSYANYSFKVLLLTFKACMPKIISSTSNKNFNSDIQKFNYICKIVEPKINDIYNRLIEVERVNKKAERIEVINNNKNGAEYQKKTKKTLKQLNDLW